MSPTDFSLLASCYLAVLSAYHVITGLLSFSAPRLALKFYRGAYGCNPIERRHLLIILRPWGALAVFAGLAGFSALACPPARVWIEASLITLLAMRVAYRIGLRAELREISGIPPRNNLINIGLLFLGIALLTADLAARYIPPSVGCSGLFASITSS
jgi:hypothetical protein